MALFVLLAFLSAQLVAVPAQAFFFGGVTIKDEKEMGHKFDVMIRANMPIVEDPEVSQYVNQIVDRLVKKIPPQPFNFKAAVILHNSLNAFAIPGGYVYVFTGLIMEIYLDRHLSEKRVFPAIDINRTGTRKEDLLLADDVLNRVWILRKILAPMSSIDSMEFLLDKMRATKSNKDFMNAMGK